MIKNSLIRAAHPGDAEAIARIYVDSWRESYRGILPQPYLHRLDDNHIVQAVRKGLSSSSCIYLVAEEAGGAPMGYICGGPERTGNPIYRSEIYELYISPGYQRQGLGRQLLSALAYGLYEEKFYSMMVWVLASNPNHRFYEKCGGLYLDAKKIPFAGQKLLLAAYGWIDITLAQMDNATN